MTDEALASLLTAPQRRLLVDCVRHNRAQRQAIREQPRRVYATRYVGGSKKQTALRLAKLGLLVVDPFPRAGADVHPTDLGRRLVKYCPEWDVLPFPTATTPGTGEGRDKVGQRNDT
jgi:hypothetical protein